MQRILLTKVDLYILKALIAFLIKLQIYFLTGSLQQCNKCFLQSTEVIVNTPHRAHVYVLIMCIQYLCLSKAYRVVKIVPQNSQIYIVTRFFAVQLLRVYNSCDNVPSTLLPIKLMAHNVHNYNLSVNALNNDDFVNYYNY